MEPPDSPRTVRFELTARSVGWVLLGGLVAWLAIQLWSVAVVLVAALLIAGSLGPLVRGLERRGIKRGWALALIFLGITVGLGAIVILTVPSLVSQLFSLFGNAPKERIRLLAWLAQYDAAAPLVKAIKAVPLDELFAGAGRQLLGYSSQIVAGIGYSVTTLFLSIYLLADSTRVTGALYAVVPRQYHVRLARIMLNLEVIVGGYVRGQVITSAMITAFMFGLLSILGVPNALALAVFGGITDVIPFIGGILAIAPAALAALGVGPLSALAVLIAMFVYQELESRILVPRLYGHVLRISPVVVLVALLIGGTLLGILGALLALPIAAGVQMVFRELRVDLPGDDRDDSAVRVRDERAEAAYERMTAGAPAVEAAVVADKIAQTIRETDVAKEETDAARSKQEADAAK